MRQRLLDRESSLAAVSRCLEGARTGRGGALFIVGEPGLGKSSLLEVAVEQAGGEFEVGSGLGTELEATVPFGLASQVLGSLDDEFIDLLAQKDGPAIEPSVPYLRLLRRLKARSATPLLLTVDDLHWADRDSLGMLAFLVRRLDPMPVAIIGALRPWPPEAEAVVGELSHTGSAGIERLEPLERDSAEVLLDGASGKEVPDSLQARAWELCEGNPLLIEQLGAVIGEGGGVPESDLGPAAFSEHLLLARFAGLDEAGMRCARAASVIGVRFRFEVAIEAAGLAPGSEEPVLESLSRSGIITDAGGGWSKFAHPLFREALYEDIGEPVRRRLHSRIFALLADRGNDAEAADHAIQADLVGDARAVEILDRLGRSALASGAVSAAARNLEAAVRLCGPNCETGLLITYARSLVAAARAEDAATVIEHLLESEDLAWTDRVEALRMVGQAGYLAGAPDLADERISEAIRIAVENLPAAAVRPLLEHATVTWMSHGPAAALPKAERARDLAVDADPGLQAIADALWAHLSVECGHPEAIGAIDAIGRRLRSKGAAELLDPARLAWPPAGIYGFAHVSKYAEGFSESMRALRLARDALERAGAANGMATVTVFIGNQLVQQGYPREALAEADRVEEFSELTPMTLPFASLIRADALFRLGRFEEGEEHRLAALRLARNPDLWPIRIWSGRIRAGSLLDQGDERASDLFLEVERLADSVGLREPSDQPWAGHAVRAHLAAGRRRDALRVTRELEERGRGHPGRWPRAIASLSRARVQEGDGDRDAAEASFAGAVEILGDIDMPMERADALLALGSFRRRSGHTVAAREPLREAIGLAESVGAAHIAEHAHSELKLAGGRRRRAVVDRDLLTAAELRVAREIATGLTNAEAARRLHLSVNTVQTHLKRIYSKLEIGSRRDLARIDLDAHSGPDRSTGDGVAAGHDR